MQTQEAVRSAKSTILEPQLMSWLVLCKQRRYLVDSYDGEKQPISQDNALFCTTVGTFARLPLEKQ